MADWIKTPTPSRIADWLKAIVKNDDTFSAAYARVLKDTGCACQEELAKKLGVRQSFITDCHRRGEFTPEILLALVVNRRGILTRHVHPKVTHPRGCYLRARGRIFLRGGEERRSGASLPPPLASHSCPA